MYIHEAIAETNAHRNLIFRSAWMDKAVILQTIFVANKTSELFRRIYTGRETAIIPWNPKTEDLTADDWAIVPGIGEGFERRLLGIWSGLGHQNRSDNSGDN